jgi:hypothetical protein
MSDEAMKEKLSLYLDGELDAAERENVRRRVESDESWRRGYDELRRTSTATRAYFESATGRATQPAGARHEAVQRIVRESTMALRKSAVQPRGLRASMRRNRPFFVLGAIGAVALAVLLVLVLQPADSTAAALLEAGAQSLEAGYYEVKIDFAQSDGTLAGALAAALPMPSECRLETGPRGLFHLRFEGPPQVTNHVGFDGSRYWSWRTDSTTAYAYASKSNAQTAAAVAIRDLWEGMRRSVVDVLESKRFKDVRVLGSEVVLPDAREWTKLETQLATGYARLWLDEHRRVRRIVSHGVTVDVAERRLQASDFDISTWAPAVTVQEVKER